MFLDNLIYVLKCTACFTGIFVLLSLCVNIVRNSIESKRKNDLSEELARQLFIEYQRQIREDLDKEDEE